MRNEYNSIDIRCGDSAIELKKIPDDSIDLVITSPPYDDIRDYNGYTFNFEAIAGELFRVIKNGGVVVWIVSDQVQNKSETGTSFRQALYFMDIGFNLHDTMIWSKDGFTFPDNTRYHQTFEYMFVFSKGTPKTFNPIKDRPCIERGLNRMKTTQRQKDGSLKKTTWNQVATIGKRFNVWDIPAEKHNVTNHPAVFPIAIPRDHIISWSNKGDLVLDPFLGSGTTALACIDTGRDCIGIEISQEYCDIAKRRVDDELAQIRMDL